MPNRIVNFADGEGLVTADLLAIGQLGEVRNGDALLYGHGVEVNADLTEYEQGFGLGGLNGLLVAGMAGAPFLSGLTVSMHGGLVARAVNGGDPPGSSGADIDGRIMRYFANYDGVTLAAEPGGSDRWDMLSVVIAPVATASATRHFKDAVTLANSSAAHNTRQEYQLSVIVTQGTPGGGIPAPSSGTRWCAVRLPAGGGNPSHEDSGGLPGIVDYTYPMRQVRRSLIQGAQGFADSSWTPTPGRANNSNPSIYSTTPSDQIFFYPPEAYRGDPAAKLVGVFLNHAILDAAVTVELFRQSLSDGTHAVTVIENVTGQMGTIDGQPRTSLLEPVTYPVWANGYAAGRTYEVAEGYAFGRAPHSTVGLRLTKDGGANVVDIASVCWVFAL